MEEDEFIPCAACASPDAPGLCGPCESNRSAIWRLKASLREAASTEPMADGLSDGPEMERAGGEPAWRDAAGNVIPVRKMTDRHLVNAIRYLQRRHEAVVLRSGGLIDDDLDGDMESAWTEFDLGGPELSCSRVYPRLLEEALRRRLEVPPIYGAPSQKTVSAEA